MELIRPSDCFYYLISRATLLATAVLKKQFEAAELPQVRPAYLGVLLTLWNQDGLGALELGRRAGLEPSSMTGLLDRMERDRLVVRAAAPGDRRAQRICLTQFGRQVRKPVLTAVDTTLGEVLDGVSEEDLARVKETLRVVLANTDKVSLGDT